MKFGWPAFYSCRRNDREIRKVLWDSIHSEEIIKQICIPVRCVLLASVVVSRGWVCRGEGCTPPSTHAPCPHPLSTDPWPHPCQVHTGIHTPCPSACWDTHPLLWTDRHMWTHYLPETSYARGKYQGVEKVTLATRFFAVCEKNSQAICKIWLYMK